MGSGRRGQRGPHWGPRPELQAGTGLQRLGPRGLCTVISHGSPGPLSLGCMSLWREGWDAKPVHRTKGRVKAVGAQGLGSHPTLFLQEGNVISGLCAGHGDGTLSTPGSHSSSGLPVLGHPENTEGVSPVELTALSLLRPTGCYHAGPRAQWYQIQRAHQTLLKSTL